MSLKCNCPKTQMLPKGKCHQILNVTKTQMLRKLQCNQNAIVTKTQMFPKRKCYQNANFTTWTNLCQMGLAQPGPVHINPNGLPGHGLSDSRLVLILEHKLVQCCETQIDANACRVC